ncbi:DUF1045 domain-containing protein [Actibacterium ureilyticum]|uniref:DUF1045 domain-containing protein n=1 Tax=Actibacterium ureilyticum TaxID=1590614 RepID=UPI000BAAC211|nr:DUF1045 domain-containing protein [Actibacterium ureilyticum]
MEGFRRYAIYVAPQPGTLADFTAQWLGWDPETGKAPVHPALPGLPAPVAQLTATPRKYGFHGTIKPPFRLAEDSDIFGLHADMTALAATLAPARFPALKLAQIGHFLALVPDGDAGTLPDLAATVVAGLDRHRAPLTEDDITRRRPDRLSDSQRDLLMRWGYPYVMDEFRFHMTLTGRLQPDQLQATADTLAPALTPLLPRPVRIDSLCLFGEGKDGRFHNLHRYALTG